MEDKKGAKDTDPEFDNLDALLQAHRNTEAAQLYAVGRF